MGWEKIDMSKKRFSLNVNLKIKVFALFICNKIRISKCTFKYLNILFTSKKLLKHLSSIPKYSHFVFLL